MMCLYDAEKRSLCWCWSSKQQAASGWPGRFHWQIIRNNIILISLRIILLSTFWPSAAFRDYTFENNNYNSEPTGRLALNMFTDIGNKQAATFNPTFPLPAKQLVEPLCIWTWIGHQRLLGDRSEVFDKECNHRILNIEVSSFKSVAVGQNKTKRFNNIFIFC